MTTDTERELYKQTRTKFVDQANGMLDSGIPFNVILSALADITLNMVIKMERGGDSKDALKKLQDFLAQRFADMAAHDPTGGKPKH